jgi:hypothetical protein
LFEGGAEPDTPAFLGKELRWYLREGPIFQFDRQSRKNFGGVVLPHVDRDGIPFCYTDELEEIRVTDIYGTGVKYTRLNGVSEDLLFDKIGWVNRNSQNGVHRNKGCLKMFSEPHVTYETSKIYESDKESTNFKRWQNFDSDKPDRKEIPGRFGNYNRPTDEWYTEHGLEIPVK